MNATLDRQELSDLDALGARRLSQKEISSARTRLERSPLISNEFEVERLRRRLEGLKSAAVRAECEKAICGLALRGNGAT